MDASPISKVLTALIAVFSAQLVCSAGAIAGEVSSGIEPQVLHQNVAVAYAQATTSPLNIEIRQFVPPDTGGPDRSGGTGTR